MDSESLTDFFEYCKALEYSPDGWEKTGWEGFALQSPEELIRHRVGNCWEQTELQRMWFERQGYRAKTFLLYYYLNDSCCPSHSILTYEDEGKVFWFEPMFHDTEVEYCGIHEYSGLEELLRDLRRVFALNGQKMGMLPEELVDSKWFLYGYGRPEYGISDGEFYEHCRKGKRWLV